MSGYSNLVKYGTGSIKAGAEVERGYSKLDFIQQLYDIKRERLNKRFESIAQGYGMYKSISRIHKKNMWLEEFGKKRGYDVDRGFLGIGDVKFYRDGKEASIYEIIMGEDSDLGEILGMGSK